MHYPHQESWECSSVNIIMEDKEHKAIYRSFILRIIFSVIVSAGFILLSYLDYILFGLGVTFTISFPFVFILSGKFFPDSCEFYSHEHRNYLRSKKGLIAIKDDHKKKAHYYDDFMRG